MWAPHQKSKPALCTDSFWLAHKLDCRHLSAEGSSSLKEVSDEGWKFCQESVQDLQGGFGEEGVWPREAESVAKIACF